MASRKLFNQTVKRAEHALQKGDLQSAIAWSKIAAHFAFVRHSGIYMSQTLENLLTEVAQKIQIDPPNVSGAFYLKSKPRNYGKMRFLHVITESYGTGGHSPFIARWIKNTSENSVHSLITTAQTGELPDILVEAIRESGGWYCSLSELSSDLVEQALLLRLLAQSWTDVIVLLVHPFDPLPNVAFGVQGGPPVIFCNHADHAFWLGSSIADIVVDYHFSAGELSAKKRGVFQSKILPIPLSKIQSQQSVLDRRELGFSDNEVILLTIGREEKFYPFDSYDFLEVLIGVLKKHPNVQLVAVGPQFADRWRVASELVGWRIKALGTVERATLEKYYSSADLYVGSFPCGSGTSMLEAGLHNLPIVGLHLKGMPHISINDDVAFQSLNVHVSSTEEFANLLDDMISDLTSCRHRATLVKENIEREHCPPGWNTYLDRVLQSLPSQHAIQNIHPPNDQIDYVDLYFEQLSSQMLANELPEHSFSRLVRVYAKHLPKTQTLEAQAACLMRALPKVNSLEREKEFLLNCREFLGSVFA